MNKLIKIYFPEYISLFQQRLFLHLASNEKRYLRIHSVKLSEKLQRNKIVSRGRVHGFIVVGANKTRGLGIKIYYIIK